MHTIVQVIGLMRLRMTYCLFAQRYRCKRSKLDEMSSSIAQVGKQNIVQNNRLENDSHQ